MALVIKAELAVVLSCMSLICIHLPFTNACIDTFPARQPGNSCFGRIGAKQAATVTATSASQCQQLCLSSPSCTAWNFASEACFADGSGDVNEHPQTRGKCEFLTGKTRLSAWEHVLRATPGSTCKARSGLKITATKGLVPLKFRTLPIGQTRAQGWLRDELVTMANGLSGHLDLFWQDVKDSVWVGGTQDKSGAGHERGPYWLNGMVSLMAQLNANQDMSRVQVDIEGQVKDYINYILEHQLPSGWLGPDDGFGGTGNTYWSGWNVAASLLQYANVVGVNTSIGHNCSVAVLNYIAEVHRRMGSDPTQDWSQNRWQDWVYIIHWAFDQNPLGYEQLLWDAAEQAQEQSFDWDAYYSQSGIGQTGAFVGKPVPKFPERNVSAWTMWDHGVNNGMGTKSCLVWYRQSGNSTEAQRIYHKLEMQDKYHGQPHGMFSADECFGGRSLNRGIELCAVVEQMYSLEINFQISGDVAFLDRCEKIAFNALPGTLSPNMWQHQYLQQANEIAANYGQNDHVWQTDGADATGFGVEPNFGCCTANLQQGWPKLVNNIFYVDEQDRLVVGIIAPAATTFAGINVTVDTLYPFGDVINISTTSDMELGIRIPSWAVNAKVVGYTSTMLVNGSISYLKLAAGTIMLDLRPDAQLLDGWGPLEVKPSASVYQPQGSTVISTVDFWQFRDGASSAASKVAGATDIRSGNQNQNGTARLAVLIEGQGHYLSEISFVYSYVAGYTPSPGVTVQGSSFEAVLVNAATNKDLVRIYQSPVLVNYSYDIFTQYSPPVVVNATGLHVANVDPIVLELRFVDRDRNLQLVLPNNKGLQIFARWSEEVSPDPPAPFNLTKPAINALSVQRGPLVFALPLGELVQVVRTWAPFNNTDVSLFTEDKWWFAINRTASITFVPMNRTQPMPFATANYPCYISVSGTFISNWIADSPQNAAADPPPSPINVSQLTHATMASVNLVPYGATNLRVSAFPWFS